MHIWAFFFTNVDGRLKPGPSLERSFKSGGDLNYLYKVSNSTVTIENKIDNRVAFRLQQVIWLRIHE